MSYHIKLFGKKIDNYEPRNLGNNVAPCQLGLDVLRCKKPKFRINVTQVKFPPSMAK